MSETSPSYPPVDEGAGVPDVLEADALVAIREPVTWIEDTIIWMIQAGMVERAQRAYQLWIELQYDREQVLNTMVLDAVNSSVIDPNA